MWSRSSPALQCMNINTVFFDPGPDRDAVDAQHPGGLALVAAGSGEGIHEGLFFGWFTGGLLRIAGRLVGGWIEKVAGEVAGLDGVLLGKDKGVFQGAF